MACAMQVPVTMRAVRKEGPFGSLSGCAPGGVARGKNIRKRRSLGGQSRHNLVGR